MASIRDIAKQTGVSIATVSRALNNQPKVSDEVRKRVLDAANRSRYVSNVARRSTSNIAFVYTGSLYLGSPFDAAMLQGMSTGLERSNLDLMILGADRSRLEGETYTQMFMRKGVRGAIIRTTAQTRDVCVQIAREGFPAVVVADQFDDPSVVSIRNNAHNATVRAVEHLLGLGHSRIAIATNIVDDFDHAERISACRETMNAAGITAGERDIMRLPATVASGAMVLRQIVGSINRPTAVLITDPMICVGVYLEAQRSGVRIPDDLSVVGFDDAQVRHTLHPQMTCVCQNAESLGADALAALIALMDSSLGRSAAPPASACWFEIHSSTSRPRA